MQKNSSLWSSLQLYTQEKIEELKSFLESSDIVISDTRNISIYLNENTDSNVSTDAVQNFGRILVCGPKSVVDKNHEILKNAGCYIETDIYFARGITDNMSSAIKNIRKNAPKNYSAHLLNSTATADDILSIQKLQADGGLVPLPRNGLLSPRATTIVAKDADQNIVGVVSLFDIERSKLRAGWYQMAAGCIETKHRGKGLGTWMHAVAISEVLEPGRAKQFIASVRNNNSASTKMLEKCGIHMDPSYKFLYASIPTPSAN